MSDQACGKAGRFITFEGIDGAGKSSHIEAVAGWLKARGQVVLVTREPGGTALAEALREMVLHQGMDALTETLLVFAARRDHLVRQIEPALARGEMVICDRFTDASFAYQGGGRGVDMQTLQVLERWVHEGRQPDLTLWFDLPSTAAAARRSAARHPDRFEQQDEDFFERVRAAYARRADEHLGRFAHIDANAERPAVWQQVQAALEQRRWW